MDLCEWVDEVPVEVRRRAAAAGCVLVPTPSTVLGRLWCLFDQDDGFHVHGHPGYPLEAWTRSDFDEFLWGRVANRLSELERARRGADPLHSYRFACPEDWQVAISHVPASELTGHALTRLQMMCPDPYAPNLLWAFHQTGADQALIRGRVGGCWSAVEYPDRALGRDQWRDLFTVAGFTRDGKPARRRRRALRLWRGSVPERRTDWSWTTDPAVAHSFAHGGRGFRPRTGTVWTALVPAEYLYAANTSRGEAEWIAEVPEELIEPAEGVCTC